MEISRYELTFMESNIVGALQQHGGEMEYKALKALSKPRLSARGEWTEAYESLRDQGIIRQHQAPSMRDVNRLAWRVVLAQTGLPACQVLTHKQLRELKNVEEDNYGSN